MRDAIVGAYGQLTIGNPLDQKNHIGPLIDKDAVNTYLAAIEKGIASNLNPLHTSCVSTHSSCIGSTTRVTMGTVLGINSYTVPLMALIGSHI